MIRPGLIFVQKASLMAWAYLLEGALWGGAQLLSEGILRFKDVWAYI